MNLSSTTKKDCAASVKLMSKPWDMIWASLGLCVVQYFCQDKKCGLDNEQLYVTFTVSSFSSKEKD